MKLIPDDSQIIVSGETYENISGSSIYMLLFDNEVVYIGQSVNGIFRIGAHLSDKVFNGIVIVPTNQDILNETEAELIVKYQPKYNSNLPANSRFLAKKSICTALGINGWEFRKLNLETVYMGTYYDIQGVL